MKNMIEVRRFKDRIVVMPKNPGDSSSEISFDETRPRVLPYTDNVSYSRDLGIAQWRELCVTIDEDQGVVILGGVHSDQCKQIRYQDTGFTRCELEFLAILAGYHGEYRWDGKLGIDFFTVNEEERRQNIQNIQIVSWTFSALFPELDGTPIVNEDCVTRTTFTLKLYTKEYK